MKYLTTVLFVLGGCGVINGVYGLITGSNPIVSQTMYLTFIGVGLPIAVGAWKWRKAIDKKTGDE
tara:strand:- start:1410 stop:1604 length:195 start_codon:yes stop_codon:yes gene_type:complete